MELKKREVVTKREYALKDEITKGEVKKFTPKKWMIASALGIVTLFYANPNSFLGKIGVVFGCAEIKAFGPTINYSSVWHSLNNFSNTMGATYKMTGLVAIIVTAIELMDYRSRSI